ncbi:MAG: hypothetical protein KH054_12040 [Firmicutes bacterium]|nr:hypothetical protein [Bacillota bacterium]
MTEREKVKTLKNKLTEQRKDAKKITLSDIQTIMTAQKTGDYTKAHETDLYKNYGGAYCVLLKILHREQRR